MKILFSCEGFSEKSFASLINRARAREAIKPNLFSLWMVGITAKRTAIHRTRRRQEGEDFGELLSRAAPAEPPLNLNSEIELKIMRHFLLAGQISEKLAQANVRGW